MKKLFCILCVCLLLALTACTSAKSTNHMNIYSSKDKKSLIVSTEDNDKILQILDIINDYKEFDSTVAIDNPDYIVELSPVDNSGSSEEYKLWIKDNKIIYLPPQTFDEPSKLSVSTHSSDDSLKILNKNDPYQYGFQSPLPQLSWGMSKNEALKALNLDESKVKTSRVEGQTFTLVDLNEKQKFFGYDAELSMMIEDAPAYDDFPYHTDTLQRVRLLYTDVDADALKKNIEKQLAVTGKDGNIGSTLSYTSWSSKDTVSSIKESNVTSILNDYWKIVDKHSKKMVSNSSSYAKSADSPINFVRLTVNKSENACMVEYYGELASFINVLTKVKSK